MEDQPKTTLSHLHTALHACSGSIVQTGAVVVVSGVDVGLLVLASLQPGPRPAQDHLAAGKPTNTCTHYLYVNFNKSHDLIQFTISTAPRKCGYKTIFICACVLVRMVFFNKSV